MIRESIPIHDITPWDRKFKTRAEEIAAYLDSHPQIYNYVILDDWYDDDYSSNPQLQAHLVHIDALKGLQDCDLIKTCEIMNRLELQKWLLYRRIRKMALFYLVRHEEASYDHLLYAVLSSGEFKK